jgi:hypothetical protein
MSFARLKIKRNFIFFELGHSSNVKNRNVALMAACSSRHRIRSGTEDPGSNPAKVECFYRNAAV